MPMGRRSSVGLFNEVFGLPKGNDQWVGGRVSVDSTKCFDRARENVESRWTNGLGSIELEK